VVILEAVGLLHLLVKVLLVVHLMLLTLLVAAVVLVL
jgi:hypothetical protein